MLVEHIGWLTLVPELHKCAEWRKREHCRGPGSNLRMLSSRLEVLLKK